MPAVARDRHLREKDPSSLSPGRRTGETAAIDEPSYAEVYSCSSARRSFRASDAGLEPKLGNQVTGRTP